LEEFFKLISNFGFPIALACYLLFRFEKKLDLLETTNQCLEREIVALKNQIMEMKEVSDGVAKIVLGLKERVVELQKTITRLKKK
jgi:hypothetical protein